MTTQHTSDHEQPDHEPRVEAGVSTDSQSESDKTPSSKKNWDKKTRRRHSVSTEDPPPAPDQPDFEKVAEPEQSQEVEQPAELEETAELQEMEESAESEEVQDPEQSAEPEELQRQDETPQPKDDPELHEDQVQETLVEVVEADETSDHDVIEDVIEEHIVEELEKLAEPEPESEQPQEPEKPAELEEVSEPQEAEEAAEPEEEAEPQETEQPVESEESQEPEPTPESKETRAPSVALLEDDFDDEFYDSLEVSTPKSKEDQTSAQAHRKPWKAKRQAQVKKAYLEEHRNPVVDQPAVQDLTSQKQQQQPQEEAQPQRQEQQPKQQPKQQQRDQRQKKKQDERQQVKQQKQDDQQRTKPQRAKRQRAQEQREQDLQRERDQQRSQQKTEREQREREQQQQQREQQKQRQRQQRYLKSSSFKQAFRNLLKLNAGTAWREMRVPIVTFFVLFSLLALAVADALPAVDAFNAAIISAVHSLRGVLDTFVVTLTTIGDFLPMAGLCLVVCLILYLAKKWDSLAFFIVNVVLAIVCVQVLKLIFAVPRPTAETLVPLPQSFSFPSAHSFCSLIVFGMIGLLIYRALIRRGVSDRAARIPGIILIVFAILVGISRIYVGVHWPSDVLGGWLLAGTWLSYVGALYTAGARQTGRHQR